MSQCLTYRSVSLLQLCYSVTPSHIYVSFIITTVLQCHTVPHIGQSHYYNCVTVSHCPTYRSVSSLQLCYSVTLSHIYVSFIITTVLQCHTVPHIGQSHYYNCVTVSHFPTYRSVSLLQLCYSVTLSHI